MIVAHFFKCFFFLVLRLPPSPFLLQLYPQKPPFPSLLICVNNLVCTYLVSSPYLLCTHVQRHECMYTGVPFKICSNSMAPCESVRMIEPHWMFQLSMYTSCMSTLCTHVCTHTRQEFLSFCFTKQQYYKHFLPYCFYTTVPNPLNSNCDMTFIHSY